MTRLLTLLLLISCLTSMAMAADIDLTQSTITPEKETVPGGELVTFHVVLKNTGDKLSGGTDVTISFPQNGFFIRMDELPELKRDDNAREISARVNLPAGGEYRFAFVLLAPRSEVGHLLSPHVEARDLLANDLDAARWNADASVKITNVSTTAGIVLGGVRFHPAAAWLLGWMVFGGVFFVWMRSRLRWVQEHPKFQSVPQAAEVRRIPALGVAALVMIALAFLMAAGGMAWRDLQALTNWQEAQSTILDRREVVKTSRDDRTASEIRRGTKGRRTTTRTPEFALKYAAGDREIISSGFEAGWSIHFGGQVQGKADMDSWVAGANIPCWYDPVDPGKVVVRRGISIACLLFALFALPILWFGLRQVRKVNAAVRRLEEIESV